MGAITPEQLSSLFPEAENDYLAQVASELNTNLPAYGLDTGLRQAHFFAQVMQETGAELEASVEKLNYNAKALVAKFSYYQKHPSEADADAYVRDPATNKITRPANQQAIGNKIYANRIGNGDVASGDGFRYRGRGFIQVTGRANYSALNTVYGQIYGAGTADFVANPDALATFPYSVRSAVCFWIQHGLDKLADHGSTDLNVDAITAVINKGTDSYADRRDNFHKAIQVFS